MFPFPCGGSGELLAPGDVLTDPEGNRVLVELPSGVSVLPSPTNFTYNVTEGGAEGGWATGTVELLPWAPAQVVNMVRGASFLLFAGFFPF